MIAARLPLGPREPGMDELRVRRHEHSRAAVAHSQIRLRIGRPVRDEAPLCALPALPGYGSRRSKLSRRRSDVPPGSRHHPGYAGPGAEAAVMLTTRLPFAQIPPAV